MLPANLRRDVVQELCGDMIAGIYFVHQCKTSFIRELLLVIELDLYMPGDFLFHSGECATVLFFVFQGGVQLFDGEAAALILVGLLERLVVGSGQRVGCGALRVAHGARREARGA